MVVSLGAEQRSLTAFSTAVRNLELMAYPQQSAKKSK